MNVLITGGAGFIGSNLTGKMLNKGYKVICLDNFDDYYSRSIKENNINEYIGNDNYFLIEGDIRDRHTLENLFGNYQIDIVIHLAAKAGVRPSILKPEEYYDVNITGTLLLLEVMKNNNVKKLVFGSSSSVYGNNKKVPFSESDNVDYPISPYAATKKSGELLCYTYSHLHNFDVACLRFFTVYGPGQRPEMAIHMFTRNISNGLPIKMFGDGSSRRDYTYVDDIIDGIVRAAENLDGYAIYNLGESQTISLKDLISVIEEKTGRKAIIEQYGQQPGDVEQTYADISKARTELGYNPSVNIRQGIESFVKWFNKSENQS